MAQTFRTAFGGFHKEDVVRYLEYLNNKHQNQVNQLNTEIAQLRAGQEAPDPDVQEALSRLEAENQQLRAQKEDLDRRCDELTAQVMGQISQLQVAVSSGKQALQDASSVQSTLRPNR